MAQGRWLWVPIDWRDVDQERALAQLEGRDPDEAAAEWIRKERYWYRFHVSFPDGDQDYVDAWVQKFYVAVATIRKPQRSLESMEQRRAYVREWWRRNGQAYRRRRSSPSRGACAEER